MGNMYKTTPESALGLVWESDMDMDTARHGMAKDGRTEGNSKTASWISGAGGLICS